MHFVEYVLVLAFYVYPHAFSYSREVGSGICDVLSAFCYVDNHHHVEISLHYGLGDVQDVYLVVCKVCAYLGYYPYSVFSYYGYYCACHVFSIYLKWQNIWFANLLYFRLYTSCDMCVAGRGSSETLMLCFLTICLHGVYSDIFNVSITFASISSASSGLSISSCFTASRP